MCYNLKTLRGVAQHGSALDWGSRGRWFKSSRSDQLKSGFQESRNPLFLLAVKQEVGVIINLREKAGRKILPATLHTLWGGMIKFYIIYYSDLC
jgi:hypothetical protein